VTSRGFDVNGVADKFTFAYRPIPDDITIVARLKTLPNVDPWAQAGLMIRRDLSAGSKHVFVFGTPGNGVVVRTRQTNGGSTSQTLSDGATVPVWLKLERRSQTLAAFRSDDGASWTLVRTVTLQMSSDLLVGLAVASHSTSSGLTAAFDSVTVNGQGWAAASVLRYQSFDLVVLDIGLPKLDGLRVLSGMRERGDSTPVLMLTARDGIEDRVQALDVGADDYLGKPFDFREFEARCRVLLRRARGQASEVVQIGGFQFDNAAHRVSLDGEPIDLPNREYRLLEILVGRLGQVVGKDAIGNGLFGFDDAEIAAIRMEAVPSGIVRS